MSIGTILVILLVVLMVSALPAWRHSRDWGYCPSSGFGLLVLILLVLVFTKRL